MEIAPEVAATLKDNGPVVALESTLITHGLPYPDNLKIATQMEGAVRESGAVPATIAVIGGTIRIGLNKEELAALSQSPERVKLSRRDLSFAMSQKQTGGTTVAGTMFCAAKAGIRAFATGGIGGVHREADVTGDISADLIELSRTPVAVVCSGAKSILDLPRTLEHLETLGVPVVGYQTEEFPAFHCRTSGLPLDQTCQTPQEAAALIRAHMDLKIKSGLLIANPVPPEAAMEETAMEHAVSEALMTARKQGIKGKAVTPFLLRELAETSKGQSLTANKALLVHNALVAGQIARAL